MVIPKRHGIILKSKAAGNPEYGPNNSAIIFFEYISLPNINSILISEFCKLPDCIFSNLYIIYPTGLLGSTNHRNMVVIPNLQVAIYPLSIIEALASKFYWSHDLTVLCLAAGYFLSFPIGFAVYIVYFNPTVGKTRYLCDNCMGESGI